MYRSRFAFALAMAALAAILLPSSLHAQITFQRTYGGAEFTDEGYSVQQTTDGGYIVVGYAKSFGVGGEDVYLIRTDSHGDTLWTRTYGGVNYDVGNSTQLAPDDGYVIAGYTSSFGAGGGDVYLIRTDAHGDSLWTRTYGGAGDDKGNSVQLTTDGGYVIAGYTSSFGAGSIDVYLIKTDASGDTQWTKTCGGIAFDWVYSVRQTTDSGYVMTGYTTSFGAGNGDVYLIKTDARGDTQWTRTYGGAGTDYGCSVQQTADGGYVVAGWTQSSGAGSADVYLIKIDANGNTLWTRTYGGSYGDRGLSVQQTADSGYIVAGYTSSFGAGDHDVYLIKTSASGDTMWTRTFGGEGWDEGNSVQMTEDGGYIVAGNAESFGAGDLDVYLIKTDSLGNVAVAEPKSSPTRAPALSLTCEPNPCRGATTISLKPQASSSKPLTLRVYNGEGRLVRSVLGIRNSSFPLDLRALPSGAYFVRIDNGNEHATTRIVLQR